MKRILVPIDFSPIAENALRYACNIARLFDSEIDLVHVFQETPGEVQGQSQVLQSNNATLEDVEVVKIEKYVSEFQSKYKDEVANIVIRKHTLLGDVAGELKEFCLQNPVRMLVMGTKGNPSEGSKKSMGSITSEVIRFVHPSVMVIPEEAVYKPIKRIVYCIDYEGYDKFTINSLASFATKFDAEIIVLHINTEPKYFDSSRWSNFQRMVNDAYDYENMRFEFLNHENVTEGIESYIKDKNVDLLAMLTRNNHLIDRVFPKSITRKMVLHSEIPLLAFHE